MTFEMVKQRYEHVLLSENRRMAIFRTYPSKLQHLIENTEYEDNAKKVHGRIDNKLIGQSSYQMYLAQ